MAKRTAPHLKQHQFKKGQPSANPQGARLHDPVTKALKKLTLESYREVIELVLTGNLAALKAMAEHPDTPAIQVGVATSIMKAIKDGDPTVLERFAARIVGKIPDEINLNSNSTVNATINTFDSEKLKAALAKIRSDV